MFNQQGTLSTLLVIMVVLAACGRVRDQPAPGANGAPATSGSSLGTLTSGGEQRRYRLHVPPSVTANQPLPLVINLHGYNSNAAQQESVSQMRSNAERDSATRRRKWRSMARMSVWRRCDALHDQRQRP
jgi:poly(3-hydroxybutyrate) depolymerase